MTSLNIPSNLVISKYLLKQCKLWVWDFDDTLIDTETYLRKNMSPASIKERTDAELDAEIPQWRYYRRLIEFLVSNGRYVGIASFGTYEIIQAYLDRIMGFNQKIFTRSNIIAPRIQQRDIGRFTIPPNKNEYIYTLMRVYRVQDFKRVVLFDDNASNIADAIAIGIIGIQIASPRNGDNTNGNMYFGPWVMNNFDKDITSKCGQEIFQNRTYTGLATKETYLGDAFNGKDINYGTGARSRDGFFMEEPGYTLGVDDSILYNNKIPAFGTGIGNRKVNTLPQFRWNNNKNNPGWVNGNYINVPGKVETPGYWSANYSLGGETNNFWEKYQTALTNSHTPQQQYIYPNNENNENNTGYSDDVDNLYKWNNSSHAKGIVEGYENKTNSSCNMDKYAGWIVLLLVLIMLGMIIIAWKY
jgi:hypothetical protein